MALRSAAPALCYFASAYVALTVTGAHAPSTPSAVLLAITLLVLFFGVAPALSACHAALRALLGSATDAQGYRVHDWSRHSTLAGRRR